MKRGDRFIKQRLAGRRRGRKLENTARLCLFFIINFLTRIFQHFTPILHIHEMITANNLERIPTDLDSVTPSVLKWHILKHSAACVFCLFQLSGCTEQHWRSWGLISPPSIPITVRGQQAEDGCSQRLNKLPQSKNDISFYAALANLFLWCCFLHICNPNPNQLPRSLHLPFEMCPYFGFPNETSAMQKPQTCSLT